MEKRGVLVVGAPQSGKTLLIRQLVYVSERAAGRDYAVATGERRGGAGRKGGAEKGAAMLAANLPPLPKDKRETAPTIGMSVDSVRWKSTTLELREVGSALSKRWPDYLRDSACSNLLFVVDASSVVRSFEAKVDFYELVSDIMSGQCGNGWRVVLALNKQDLPGSFDADALLRVSDLRKECCGASTPISHICKAEVSAVDETGVAGLLDLLASDSGEEG